VLIPHAEVGNSLSGEKITSATYFRGAGLKLRLPMLARLKLPGKESSLHPAG
jgi:hypothetical protein